MALPKLNTPKHELELPSTGEKVKFRPFLVKEQKLLMMAQESDKEEDISEAVMNIIDACTTGLDARKLPIFDIEYIFLQLRTKSVGETADIKVKCPDDDKTFVNVNLKLDDIAVHMTEDHTNVVQLQIKFL